MLKCPCSLLCLPHWGHTRCVCVCGGTPGVSASRASALIKEHHESIGVVMWRIYFLYLPRLCRWMGWACQQHVQETATPTCSVWAQYRTPAVSQPSVANVLSCMHWLEQARASHMHAGAANNGCTIKWSSSPNQTCFKEFCLCTPARHCQGLVGHNICMTCVHTHVCACVHACSSS